MYDWYVQKWAELEETGAGREYAQMFSDGKVPYVSPRPGMYISFCPVCFNWRPLLPLDCQGQLENTDDPVLITSLTGMLTANGTVPGVDLTNQPQICLKCSKQVWGQFDGTSEDELAQAQDALDHLNSMLSLIRLGFTPRKAVGTLKITE